MAVIRRLVVLLVVVASVAALGPVGARQRHPGLGRLDRVSRAAAGSSSPSSSSYSSATYGTDSSSHGYKRSTSSLSPKMQYAIRHLSDSIWLNAIADSLPYYPDIQPALPAPLYPSTGWSWPAGTGGTRPSRNGGPYYGNGGPYYGNGGPYYPGNGGLYPPGSGGLYPPGSGGPYYPGNGGSYNPGSAPGMRPSGQRNSRDSVPNASGASKRPGSNDPADSEVAGSN